MAEYGDDLDISSLSRLKGERKYLRALKHGRTHSNIDLVLDYDQLDDGANRQGLEYHEKFTAQAGGGRRGARGIKFL